MPAKLTLSLKSSVIKAAKKYASENKTSVSHLVEQYFIDLIYMQQKNYSKKVQDLIGIAKLEEPPPDYKMEKLKYLEEKYLSE